MANLGVVLLVGLALGHQMRDHLHAATADLKGARALVLGATEVVADGSTLREQRAVHIDPVVDGEGGVRGEPAGQQPRRTTQQGCGEKGG
eukprot:CAMPEP_0204034488 /NCGR_PEP_ID=MMETSP0360-20130528/74108_1 /ASSEMBLY_ACC=CAM_ASM_000342 /TAXON_ID=268821 /ORGANISM="Scrippsiella Hangoei, Strain SHTV-5" /LENGTH=89 /DNA_ID=CAMNT_0050979307 /DNA_START=92 /DNA_END=358 /DNA_ORIENTATION=+